MPEPPVLDITDPAAPTLDGQPLTPKVGWSISRGRSHPDGPLVGTEVEIGGTRLSGVRVVRDGVTVADVPE